jgi:serine/threonine protein kinase
LDAFDLFKLETAAKQDREDLRSNLELLRHDHVCDGNCARSEAEECLAARFPKTTVPRPTAVAAVPAATTIKLASLLWRVSPEDLPIVRRLGKGGYGEVCETEWLGDKYAKKEFPNTSFQTFKAEAAILAGLFHPNVVRIVCWSKERETGYSLVMHLMQEDLLHFLSPPPTDTGSSDFDDDVSLSTAAATVPLLSTPATVVPSSIPNSAAVVVPLSMPVAVDLMLQVAKGLKYLHRNNIVHRDIKSLNILVKPLTGVPELEYKEGYLSAKLADFGTSKTKNESTRRSHLTLDIGTTAWMAPEMFGIDRSTVQWPQIAHPFKTDVYSFALVCYEILTRKQPFEGVPRSELCNWITVRHERPELPERCPRRLASLIQRCWEHDPCHRPNFPEICTELRYIKGLLLTGK